MRFIVEVSVPETGGAQFERNRRGQLARRRRPPERGVKGVNGIGADSAAPRFRTRGILAAIVSRCPWGRKGARGAPAARARIEQLGGMPPRLDVVLRSEIDAHKKTSHFSCPRNGRGSSKTKRVSSCLAGGEGLLGSELLQFCQNAAHEHAVGEGEAVARARRRQGVVDEEAAALGIANRIQAIDDLVLGVEHFEINGGFKAA